MSPDWSEERLRQEILGFKAQLAVYDPTGVLIVKEGEVVTNRMIAAAREAGVLPLLVDSVKGKVAPPVPQPPLRQEHGIQGNIKSPVPATRNAAPTTATAGPGRGRGVLLAASGLLLAALLGGGGYFGWQYWQKQHGGEQSSITDQANVDDTPVIPAEPPSPEPSATIPPAEASAPAEPASASPSSATTQTEPTQASQATSAPPDTTVNASSTSTTSAPTPVENKISDEDVQNVVRQYLNSSTQSDLAATLNLYTDQIDYFDKETISKAAVYDDKHAYLERWPNRSYDLASSVATLASTDNTRQVRFDYNYRVSGSGKEASGKAYTILSLQKSDGKVLITGEKGGVYPKPVSHTAPAASPTNSTPSASGAPRFPQWYFTTCQDASSGARQTGLSVGRLQRCDLVIETVPNGAEPIEAVFNYELEYQQNGTTQKFMVDAPDHWPSSSEPVTNFRREGNNLIFTLPLTVKDRTDRRYTSINAIGDIRFSNSSSKRIYERLPIH